MSIASQLYKLVVKFHFQVHTFYTNIVYISLIKHIFISSTTGQSLYKGFRLIIPNVCLAQFNLSNVHKRDLKHHHFLNKVHIQYCAYM